MELDLWTFRQPLANVDLTGFEVEALDGRIGKVDEATYEAGGSFIVLETGPWIFGKKVMLPARTIERIDFDERRIFVDRTQDEIKNGPEFDPDLYREPVYHEKLAGYYGDFYRM